LSLLPNIASIHLGNSINKEILAMKASKISLIISTSLIISACGGGDSGGDSSDPVTQQSSTYTGSFVVPQTLSQNSSRTIHPVQYRSYSASCPNVPDGYIPMANASVTLEGSDGESIGSDTTTDHCGVFKLTVPVASEELTDTVLSADLDGYKTLKAHAKNFVDVDGQDGESFIASTIPMDATYIISAIQKADSDELMFSVTDSSTNNAVIQLTKVAFQLTVNDQPMTISSLNSSDQLGVASSNVLALDGSGSMYSEVRDANYNYVVDDNLNPYTLHRLTALAAHQFVSEKSDSDEIAVIAFDSYVDLIDQAFIDGLTLLDIDDNEVTFTYSESGFATGKSQLHFAIDLYNPSTEQWGLYNAYDQAHSGRTDNIASISNYYAWGGGTELEGAINDSLTAISERNNAIKRVFVMTDGNSYFSDRQLVIDTAKQNAIPVNAIAVGTNANDTDLKEIAEQTGGVFHLIEEPQNIVGIYSALQTSIKYAYLASLSSPLQAGDEVKLSLQINDETVERVITIE
jgi:hypothetical protein